MKNKLLYFSLALILGLVSCSKNEPLIDYAIISGEIKNSESDTLMIFDKLDNTSYPNNPLKKIPIDKKGNFLDTVKLKEGTYSLFFNNTYNGCDIFLSDGYNLKLTFDSKNFSTTKRFSGIGIAANDYLSKKELLQDSLNRNYSNRFRLDENKFLESVKKTRNYLTSLLNSDKNIPESFKTIEKNNILYNYLLEKAGYESQHAYYIKDSTFTVTKGFKKELNDIDYNNETIFKTSPSYKQFIENHYFMMASENNNFKTPSEFINFYLDEVIGKKIESELIKNELLYNFSVSAINNTEDVETYFSKFKSLSTNKEHIAKITKMYNALKLLDKGNPSPKFVNYENHAGGTKSLDNFKGKYVYIDVWATWCKPCLKEVPDLKKVEKKYRNKNIEFVSISIDTKEAYEKWKQMVKELQLSGVQLLADNNVDSKFIASYKISSIPRFILIDPNGNIVNSSAPRPSDPELIKLLDSLNL